MIYETPRQMHIAFSERLTELLQIAGEDNHSAFARKIGCKYDNLRTWLIGRSYPRPFELQRLCGALGVTADFILFGESRTLSIEAYEKYCTPTEKPSNPV